MEREKVTNDALHRPDVQREIESLRGIDDEGLEALKHDSIQRRLEWFCENKSSIEGSDEFLLGEAYALLLERLRITADEAPIVHRAPTFITFHSCNFCPTLEACKLLGLDTRYVCKRLNEESTDLLLKQLNPRLDFSRNYAALRPYIDYCEETISLT